MCITLYIMAVLVGRVLAFVNLLNEFLIAPQDQLLSPHIQYNFPKLPTALKLSQITPVYTHNTVFVQRDWVSETLPSLKDSHHSLITTHLWSIHDWIVASFIIHGEWFAAEDKNRKKSAPSNSNIHQALSLIHSRFPWACFNSSVFKIIIFRLSQTFQNSQHGRTAASQHMLYVCVCVCVGHPTLITHSSSSTTVI